jgi:hypothetical protein
MVWLNVYFGGCFAPWDHIPGSFSLENGLFRVMSCRSKAGSRIASSSQRVSGPLLVSLSMVEPMFISRVTGSIKLETMNTDDGPSSVSVR